MSSSRKTSVAKAQAKNFWKGVMGGPLFDIGQRVKLEDGRDAKVVGVEDGARRLYDRQAGWVYTVQPVPEYTTPSRLTGLAWPLAAFNARFVPEGVLAQMQA